MATNPTENHCFSEELHCVICHGLLGAVVALHPVGKFCDKCLRNRIRSLSPTYIQKAALNNVSNGLIISCENISQGCKEDLLFDKLKTHQDNCQFKPVKCLEKSCVWEGIKGELLNHFKVDHKNDILEEVDGTIKFNFNLETATGTELLRILVVNKEAVYYLAVKVQTENISYKLYTIDDTSRSIYINDHSFGDKVREIKSEIDAHISANSENASMINTSNWRSVLKVSIILNFLHRQAFEIPCMECLCRHPEDTSLPCIPEKFPSDKLKPVQIVNIKTVIFI